MYEKITAPAQVINLQIGDVLSRRQSSGTEDFEIRTIRPGNQMLGLVAADAATRIFPSPGDIARLFIQPQELITEQIWWIDPAANEQRRR